MSSPFRISISSWCSCCSDVNEGGGTEEPTERTRLLGNSNANEAINKNDMLKICCSGFAGVIFLIFGIVVAILYDPFVQSFIDKELVIKNDSSSQTYKYWVDPPVVPYLKVYFFNVTNSDEFLHLQHKPILQEVGPYSYREKWEKVNITFHKNGTVTYQTRKMYYFDRSKSAGSEDDVIQTLNIPVNVAVQKIAKMGRLAELALSSMLAVLKETAFVKKTVKQLLWGYKDPLIDMANRYMPPEQRMPFDKFGYFYQKNGSTDGRFNVFTGADNISLYTIIDTFNNSHDLPYWKTPECNRINGTDGTSYPPRRTKSDVLYMFNENLCRSLPLIYNNTNKHSSIESYRFVPPKDVFASVDEKPENECFCIDGPPCIGGGVFNISACRFNVSSVLSWPHFYQADQKYLDAVIGLKPDVQKHSLYIDVNPQLGMPLAAQARIQINFQTLKAAHIKAVATMTEMIFPVLWFEDGVTTLPPEIISLLEKSTYLPKVVKTCILCAAFIVGILLIGLSVVLFLMRRHMADSVVAITKGSSQYPPQIDTGHTNPVISAEHPD